MRNKALPPGGGRPPTIINGTLPSPRRRNEELRPREFLTGQEVERLRKAAGDRPGRHPHRDSTMILLAYCHGPRASELVGLRRDMLDLDQGLPHVRRLKRGRPSTHILHRLRRLRRPRPTSSPPSGAGR
jgi:type 1 fimbriae regulatory protein FimB/type 1 fimbriae regulatory protein FimE